MISIIDKKQMTEEDIRFNYITPALIEKVGKIKLRWKPQLNLLMVRSICEVILFRERMQRKPIMFKGGTGGKGGQGGKSYSGAGKPGPTGDPGDPDKEGR